MNIHRDLYILPYRALHFAGALQVLRNSMYCTPQVRSVAPEYALQAHNVPLHFIRMAFEHDHLTFQEFHFVEMKYESCFFFWSQVWLAVREAAFLATFYSFFIGALEFLLKDCKIFNMCGLGNLNPSLIIKM